MVEKVLFPKKIQIDKGQKDPCFIECNKFANIVVNYAYFRIHFERDINRFYLMTIMKDVLEHSDYD